MKSLSVTEISLILQILGSIIAILALLLLFLRLTVQILRLFLRQKMAGSNVDMVGQQALVRKTVRSKRPGQIELEWKGRLQSAPAIANQTIRPGKPVLIYAVEDQVFRVRPIVYNYVEGRYEISE